MPTNLGQFFNTILFSYTTTFDRKELSTNERASERRAARYNENHRVAAWLNIQSAYQEKSPCNLWPSFAHDHCLNFDGCVSKP
jgi:hypothetical protein